jgi:hypothetical protein
LGTSEELRKALSALSAKNPYPENPVFLSAKYFILRLKEKKEIDLAQFNSRKENYLRALLQQKQEMVLTNWLDGILEQVKAKGQFKMIREANEVL